MTLTDRCGTRIFGEFQNGTLTWRRQFSEWSEERSTKIYLAIGKRWHKHQLDSPQRRLLERRAPVSPRICGCWWWKCLRCAVSSSTHRYPSDNQHPSSPCAIEQRGFSGHLRLAIGGLDNPTSSFRRFDLTDPFGWSETDQDERTKISSLNLNFERQTFVFNGEDGGMRSIWDIGIPMVHWYPFNPIGVQSSTFLGPSSTGRKCGHDVIQFSVIFPWEMIDKTILRHGKAPEVTSHRDHRVRSAWFYYRVETTIDPPSNPIRSSNQL